MTHARAASAAQMLDTRVWPSEVTIERWDGDEPSGYGTLIRQVKRGLAAQGVSAPDAPMISITQTMRYRRQMVEERDTPYGPRNFIAGTDAFARFGTKTRAWVLDHPIDEDYAPVNSGTRAEVRMCIGLPNYANFADASHRVLLTMWEASEIPTKVRPWAPHIQRAGLIIVPAENSRRAILDQVPGADVRVVPLALDADEYSWIDRGDRTGRPFTFVMVGDLSVRKGIVEAYDAFWRAFEGDPNVRLIFKTRAGSEFTALRRMPRYHEGEFVKDRVRYNLVAEDPNVRVLRGDFSRAALRKLYAHADAFVWASRGEGWGYPPREAAATGLPVITAAHTGLADAAEWAYVVQHHEGARPAIFRHWGGQCGTFAQVDVDDMAARMRWVYEHRAEAMEFGKRAAAVVSRRSSADMAADILDAIATMEVKLG